MELLLRKRNIHCLPPILPEERTSVYQKYVDRLECLSSHLRERLTRTHTYIQFRKETIFRGARIHTHQGSPIYASDES
jgi:hypothetical protein